MKKLLCIILFLLTANVGQAQFNDSEPTFGQMLNLGHWATDGLVFYWRGIEAGEAVDKSLYRNHGAITGATWVGDGLFFDGSNNDVVDLGSDSLIPSTDDWTFHAIIRPDASSDQDTLFSQYLSGVGNGRILIQQSDDSGPITISIFLGSDPALGSIFVNPTTAVVAGMTYHVTFTRRYRTFSVYINGVFENSTTEAGTRQILQTGNVLGIRSGSNPYNGNYDTSTRWNGLMSDIKIYNRALSDSEIQALYINPGLPMQQQPIWLMYSPVVGRSNIFESRIFGGSGVFE